jgi:putative glycosyltransferase (TIGR04372 family)
MATLEDYTVAVRARLERALLALPGGPTIRRVRDATRARLQAFWHSVDRSRRRQVDQAAARLRRFANRPRVGLLRARLLLLVGGASAARLAAAGSAEARVGRVDKAFERWSRALVLEPELFGVYEEYAYELWQRGRWDDAADLYERREEVQRRLAKERMLDWLPFTLLDRQFAAAVGVTAMLDVHVKQQILAGVPTERSLLLTHQWSLANRSYLDYWRRYLPVRVVDHRAYDAIQPMIDIVRVTLHGFPHPDGRARTYVELGADVQARWEAEGREPLLALSGEHLERGRDTLEQLGVPRDAWFVTLHIREDGYHPTRNADLLSYRQAIEAITDRGGWVVRMGDRIVPDADRSMSKLPPLPQVLDYTHSDVRSDWMDVFLWGGCRFLLGTLSGPAHVAATFGVPAIYTNWLIGYRSWYGDDLAVPKLYWSEGEGRYLTFEEALSTPVGFTHMAEPLEQHGVRIVDNTPEQIAAVAIEMIERLDGNAVYTADDEELQRRYDSFEPPLRHRRPAVGARIGRDFLREHRDLVPR